MRGYVQENILFTEGRTQKTVISGVAEAAAQRRPRAQVGMHWRCSQALRRQWQACGSSVQGAARIHIPGVREIPDYADNIAALPPTATGKSRAAGVHRTLWQVL